MASRWKMAALTWLGVYPLLTAFLVVLRPALTSLPFLLQTFVYTLILVPLMTFVVMPLLMRTFSGWLSSNAAKEATYGKGA